MTLSADIVHSYPYFQGASIENAANVFFKSVADTKVSKRFSSTPHNKPMNTTNNMNRQQSIVSLPASGSGSPRLAGPYLVPTLALVSPPSRTPVS
jgi:hypothetical protein